MRDEHLIHLLGYAAIAAVLASATWATHIGVVVGYGFALWAFAVFVGDSLYTFATSVRAWLSDDDATDVDGEEVAA